MQGPPQAACLGLALRKGCPALRLAAGKRRRRADLSRRRRCAAAAADRRLGGGDQPPHFPDCRRQAGRAAAPPPHRVGRVSPAGRGAGGTRTARRRGADGSPFSYPVTVSRDKREKGAPQALPFCWIEADVSAAQRLAACPCPHRVKSLLSYTAARWGNQHRGAAPVPRKGLRPLTHHSQRPALP